MCKPGRVGKRKHDYDNRPRKTARLGYGTAILAVTIVLLLAPYSRAFTPPWSGSFASITNKSTTAAGYYSVVVSPSANNNNGYVYTDTAAGSTIAGAATITTEEGFWGPSGAFNNPHNYNVYYNWSITWIGSASTSICFLGASYADLEIDFYANVYDVSSGTWVLPNDASTNVVSLALACGLTWGGYGTNAQYQVSFAASFLAHVTYQYYTFMEVTVTAGAAGLAGASADANVGNTGYYAVLNSVSMY